MYLKVQHVIVNGVTQDATVQLVVEALGDLLTEHQLTVNFDLGHPEFAQPAVYVEFPEQTKYFGSYCFIRDHLEDAGFEVG